MLNGEVFHHEGVVKMAAFSQHVVTVPEGRNRVIQRSKYRQQLSLSVECMCVCTVMHVNVKVCRGGNICLFVCVRVSHH